MVSSAMPSSSTRSSSVPTLRSWSIMVSWYGDCQRPAWSEALRLGVRPEVHVRHVHPDEERGVRLVLALDEIDAGAGGFVVDGLHPLLGQRSGVLDALLADRAVALVDLAGVLVGGPGVDDAAGQQRGRASIGASSAVG